MGESSTPEPTVRFGTHPDRYRHWALAFDGPVARLTMNVKEDGGLRPGYPLKLNSYDLGVGYELALACDEIVLIEDGSSAVSLPEAPLLGVLPGTGGLTRLVDKRKIRRDVADVFSTVAEGVRGKRALEWGLVDEAPARSQFEAAVTRRAQAM